jgi:hypothetical protein
MTDLSIFHTWRRTLTPLKIEWYRHMKGWKRFCDEEKIRRQQRKEELRDPKDSAKLI